jgi:uncharacterized integral membrane protein
MATGDRAFVHRRRLEMEALKEQAPAPVAILAGVLAVPAMLVFVAIGFFGLMVTCLFEIVKVAVIRRYTT